MIQNEALSLLFVDSLAVPSGLHASVPTLNGSYSWTTATSILALQTLGNKSVLGGWQAH
jgi:hypothetical protein